MGIDYNTGVACCDVPQCANVLASDCFSKADAKAAGASFMKATGELRCPTCMNGEGAPGHELWNAEAAPRATGHPATTTTLALPPTTTLTTTPPAARLGDPPIRLPRAMVHLATTTTLALLPTVAVTEVMDRISALENHMEELKANVLEISRQLVNIQAHMNNWYS